jgi:hypothetical protein
MKSLIVAGFLVAASGVTTLDPLSLLGQTDSEVSLLMAWGIALLVAGRHVRARLNPEPARTSVRSSQLHTVGAEAGARS